MYDSFEAFKEDALTCGSEYYSDSSLQPQKIDVAYKVYQNARQGTKLLDADGNTIAFGVTIVGRLARKEKSGNQNGEEYTWLRADESFPSIDQIMKENLGTLDEESNPTGSILEAKDWSLLCNDAWLLGGIHAQTEFHFASPLSWSNLWDENKQRITVTARELIGITAHGYQVIRPNPQLEAIATCADQKKARNASLITYKNYVLKYQTEADLRQFSQNLPSSARVY